MNTQSIEVLIKRKIYASDNRYSVYLVMLNDKTQKIISAVGYVGELEIDQLYSLTGKFKEHYRYGLQFDIESYQRLLANTKDLLVKFLSGPLFPGIGKVKAEKIVDYYGENFLYDVQDNSEFEFTDSFLTYENQQTLLQQLSTQDQLEQQINFLTQHGITMRQTLKIESVYGSEAIEKIKENPYRMVDEIDGIGFKTCDKLALSLGFTHDDPLRLQAIIVYEVLQDCLNTGSTYTTLDVVYQRFLKYNVQEHEFEAQLINAQKDGRIVIEDQDIYHKSQYEAEVICANYFESMPKYTIDHKIENLSHHISNYELKNHIVYDDSQIKAIENFFEYDKTLITGGPGTGKTTIIHAIISLFRELYPHYHLAICAPTGRAAKRLKELVEVEVTTIHSLLEWNLETNTFGKNEANPVLADVLIVDEFSMVDSFVMSALALATPKVRKILFIGDKDQLPSVGPGFLIRDVIESGLFEVSVLEVNYRQNQGSNIIDLAQSINQGEFREELCKNDVLLVPHSKSMKNAVVQIVGSALQKGYSIDDVQVLACKYDGSDGIDQMNLILQRQFNPKDEFKRELQFGYMTFREGDKLLQLKNQPDDFVFNGDIGTLVEIIHKHESEENKEQIVVDFEGTIVFYDRESMINLKHAYCTSVHKAQGSEYPIVLFLGSPQHKFMMNKRLFYTASTRARNSLILVGEPQIFKLAANFDHSSMIKTKLVERISRL